MSKNKFKYIFGPVPSRRLGHSLGIDLMPFKVCSFDCVYCQLGPTTRKTLDRKEYYPLNEILGEIVRKLKNNRAFDYITLSGSGEPTLHSRIGELIQEIKKLTDKPLAVLTNGSLLWDEQVRADLMDADLVIPSLDAGNQDYFEHINRPCEGLKLDRIIDGLQAFAREFRGKMWLEVFLLDEINNQSQMQEIAQFVKRINPTLTQLNTVARPPCEKDAIPLNKQTMENALRFFPKNTEIIADFSAKWKDNNNPLEQSEIINLLNRRPCSSDDIASSLGIHHIEVLKVLEELVAEQTVETQEMNNRTMYMVKQQKIEGEK